MRANASTRTGPRIEWNMSDKIKLAPANTNTVKMSCVILEEQMKRLEDYTRCYNETYGASVKPQDLVPQIVAHFLETDRGYRTWRGRRAKINGRPAPAAVGHRSRESVPDSRTLYETRTDS